MNNVQILNQLSTVQLGKVLHVASGSQQSSKSRTSSVSNEIHKMQHTQYYQLMACPLHQASSKTDSECS